ncbi:MAG: hypothetical protein RIB98_08820 [Acidimicrobiales bacterium]
MLLAAYQDTPYNIMLFVHILTMFAAFAPMFVHPFIDRETQGNPSVRQAIFAGIATRSMRIHSTMLIIGGLLGFGLAGMSKVGDELLYSVSDGWLWPAAVLWFAMVGVLHAMVIPGEKAIASGDDTVGRKAEIGGMLITLMFLVTLYLMVFKPGA